MKDNATQSPYLRRREAARYLGVSPRTISDWQAQRRIPHIKVGRRCVLFRVVDLDKAMAKLTVDAIG